MSSTRRFFLPAILLSRNLSFSRAKKKAFRGDRVVSRPSCIYNQFFERFCQIIRYFKKGFIKEVVLESLESLWSNERFDVWSGLNGLWEIVVKARSRIWDILRESLWSIGSSVFMFEVVWLDCGKSVRSTESFPRKILKKQIEIGRKVWNLVKRRNCLRTNSFRKKGSKESKSKSKVRDWIRNSGLQIT